MTMLDDLYGHGGDAREGNVSFSSHPKILGAHKMGTPGTEIPTTSGGGKEGPATTWVPLRRLELLVGRKAAVGSAVVIPVRSTLANLRKTTKGE
jgi:hypothetical protein